MSVEKAINLPSGRRQVSRRRSGRLPSAGVRRRPLHSGATFLRVVVALVLADAAHALRQGPARASQGRAAVTMSSAAVPSVQRPMSAPAPARLLGERRPSALPTWLPPLPECRFDRTAFFPARRHRIRLGRRVNSFAHAIEPVASAIGCQFLVNALCERSCALLLPDSYATVGAWHTAQRKPGLVAMRSAVKVLCSALAADYPADSFKVQARVKTLASVLDKVVLRGKRMHDMLACRIIVDDVDVHEADARSRCYAIAHLVSSLWPENRSRRKDYIRMPKGNGYQSLHLSVQLPDGKVLEVQIRTATMHAVASRGSAAWSAYKRSQPLDSGVDWRQHHPRGREGSASSSPCGCPPGKVDRVSAYVYALAAAAHHPTLDHVHHVSTLVSAFACGALN